VLHRTQLNLSYCHPCWTRIHVRLLDC
jgi:hypothetical protein